jgi:hypothetical protein
MIDKETVIKIMKDRGYDLMSECMTAGETSAVNFISHITDEVTIHAKVRLKSETVLLSFVELKYFCNLIVGEFDLHHKEFEKYEQVLVTYAAQCVGLDVFAILDKLKPKAVEEVTAPKKDEVPIKVRKRALWDEVVKVGKDKSYHKDMCLEFYDHWTEMNPGGKKMRFEMQKIFDVEKRLRTWLSNDKKWSKTFVDKKVEQQNKEVTKEVTKIKKEDLF